MAGRRIGSGWGIYDRVLGVGDYNSDGKNDLVARKLDGSLWFYAGTGRVSATDEGYRPVVKIGEFGWDAFDSLLGVRDFDGDGRPDLAAAPRTEACTSTRERAPGDRHGAQDRLRLANL